MYRRTNFKAGPTSKQSVAGAGYMRTEPWSQATGGPDLEVLPGDTQPVQWSHLASDPLLLEATSDCVCTDRATQQCFQAEHPSSATQEVAEATQKVAEPGGSGHVSWHPRSVQQHCPSGTRLPGVTIGSAAS